MKSGLLFLILMTVVVLASVGCWAYYHHKTAHDEDDVSDLCIVTSGHIKKGKAVEVSYNGQYYKLCCAGCKSIFEKDPARFVARREQQAQAQSSNGGLPFNNGGPLNVSPTPSFYLGAGGGFQPGSGPSGKTVNGVWINGTWVALDGLNGSNNTQGTTTIRITDGPSSCCNTPAIPTLRLGNASPQH